MFPDELLFPNKNKPNKSKFLVIKKTGGRNISTEVLETPDVTPETYLENLKLPRLSVTVFFNVGCLDFFT